MIAWTNKNQVMNIWTNEQTPTRMKEWIYESNEQTRINKWLYEWADKWEWRNESTYKWKNKGMNKWMNTWNELICEWTKSIHLESLTHSQSSF